MKILIRADGSNLRGYGHISKQIVLTNKLKSYGHEVLFVTQKNDIVCNILSKNDINHTCFKGQPCYNIDDYIKSFKPDIVVLDILNTTTKYIKQLRKYKFKIITFDNTDASAFLCDIIFNTMYYHDDKLKMKHDVSKLYEGYEYTIIDERYKHVRETTRLKTKRVLLSQGGADTSNRTPFLMETLIALREDTGVPFDVDVVVGPVFDQTSTARIEEIANTHDMFHVHRKPDNLARLIEACDIAITAGGTTMWEIAACKRPMYVFINEPFEDETARVISSLGFALYDGYLPDRDRVHNSLKRLVEDTSLKREFVRNMKKYDIGNGLSRVIDRIYKHGVQR